MITKFESGKTYRHSNAKDLDMVVIRVLTETPEEVKLYIALKYRRSNDLAGFEHVDLKNNTEVLSQWTLIN